MKEKKDFSYQAVFNETVDSIFITDGISGKIIDVNNSANELLGYSKDELIGQNLSKILDGGNGSQLPKSPTQFTMFGSVLSNKEIKTKSGEIIHVDMIINTFSDENDNYVFTSLRDVSERIGYENKIISINEELRKSNASKDKFFSIIAHDLKNPISAIIGLSEIVTDKDDIIEERESQEYLEMIKNLSRQTFELLENLLNWSRIQTNNIEVKKDYFDLNKQIDKIINILMPSAELKKISLINGVDENYNVFGDSDMIGTIIRNLVSNSIKFSSQDSNITIYEKSDSNYWYISVSDEGVGMEESYIANLFDIDVHTSRQGTNKEKGTGIGLLLCSEFAKLNGGSIEVNSIINEGTTFTIKLPKEI
ncbi:MAG: PAS domain-containing sensor histidine kinase [Bacteroidetes bacterium]|nr:PAS domain-containing sensor histidine kinase [Bacteroidota bacterium]MBU1115426.1 PAS domain-containing sensor histidine kinase [Bacteroidota bacterium]MBU1797947.1 PAS domain-containing sensor histidine kinase [Bacteroidota bacterium]